MFDYQYRLAGIESDVEILSKHLGRVTTMALLRTIGRITLHYDTARQLGRPYGFTNFTRPIESLVNGLEFDHEVDSDPEAKPSPEESTAQADKAKMQERFDYLEADYLNAQREIKELKDSRAESNNQLARAAEIANANRDQIAALIQGRIDSDREHTATIKTLLATNQTLNDIIFEQRQTIESQRKAIAQPY